MSASVQGVELPNDNWEPVRYCLELAVPHAISASNFFLLKETILVRRKSTSKDLQNRQIKLHAGPELCILCTEGAALLPQSNEEEKMSRVTFDLGPAKKNEVGAGGSDAGEYVEFVCYMQCQYRTDMKGFYKSTFSEAGETRTIISTHFEPIAARNCFICVDEPSVRCDIDIRLALAENEENSMAVAASGGQELGEIKSGQIFSWNPEAIDKIPSEGDVRKEVTSATYRVWEFATVPKISTYLAVLMVGPMDHASIEAKSVKFGKIPIRYFIPKGTDKEKIQFALKAAKEAFEYFEGFFAPTAFPLPKLDFAAIPQFSIGGEESFGLITTYTQVLMSEESTAVRIKSFVTALVAHELSHNWFGDIVSIQFWSGLYLKEGFASYFGWDGCQQLHPQWEPMETAAEDVFSALATDGLEGTHPLEQVILDEGAIVESFDSISYNKGQGLVFMLASFLGPDLFRQGLSAYIAQYSWQSTTTPQLWQSLEDATGVSIASVMSDYVTKPGYPVVSVGRKGSTVILKQCKYRTRAAKKQRNEGEEELWKIPVTITVYKKPIVSGEKFGEPVERQNVILSGSSTEVELKSITTTGTAAAAGDTTGDGFVVLVNEDHTGFFRTSYDQGTMSTILESYASLNSRARRGLVDDVFALVDTSVESASVHATALIKTLSSPSSLESSLRVLQAFSVKAPEFLATLTTEKKQDLTLLVYEPFVRLTQSLGNKTIKGEDPAATQLRPTAWKMACRYQEILVAAGGGSLLPECVTGFDTWAATVALDKDFKDPDMANILAARYVRSGGAVAMETMWAHLKGHSEDISQVRLALSGLSQTTDQDLFDDFVSKGIQAEVIHNQFGAWIMMHAASNPTCSGSIWRIFKNHFEKVMENWGAGQFRIQSIVESVSHSITAKDSAMAIEWQEFFEAHPIPNAALAIQRGEERVRLSAIQA